jgi:hypothetical protein
MHLPWEYHPALNKPNLIEVAQLIAQGRGNALDRYDAAVGDDSWTLGVCAFNYGRHEIILASKDGEHPWLSIADPSRRFVFRIGGIPVRFYRGDPQEPRPNMLYQVFDEFRQLSLPLEDGLSLEGVEFRIAMETDEAGDILQISFIAIRGSAVESVWPIPFNGTSPDDEVVEEHEAEGADLPAPSVDFPDEGEDREKSKK